MLRVQGQGDTALSLSLGVVWTFDWYIMSAPKIALSAPRSSTFRDLLARLGIQMRSHFSEPSGHMICAANNLFRAARI